MRDIDRQVQTDPGLFPLRGAEFPDSWIRAVQPWKEEGAEKPPESRDSKTPCPCEMQKLLIGAARAPSTDHSMMCFLRQRGRQAFIKSDTRELIQLTAVTLSPSPFPLDSHCSLISHTFMSKVLLEGGSFP